MVETPPIISPEDDLTKALTCSVCLELFDKPKVLAKCGHSVCQDCIDKILVFQQQQNMLTNPFRRRSSDITCPECCQQNLVPEGDTNELPTNFPVQQAADALRRQRSVQPRRTQKQQTILGDQKSVSVKLTSDINLMLQRREKIMREKVPALLSRVQLNVDRYVKRITDDVQRSNAELLQSFQLSLQRREEMVVKAACDLGSAQLAKFEKMIDKAGGGGHSIEKRLGINAETPAPTLLVLYEQLLAEDEQLIRALANIQKEAVTARLVLFQNNDSASNAIDEALLEATSAIVKWTDQLMLDEAIVLLQSASVNGHLATVREVCEHPNPRDSSRRSEFLEFRDAENCDRTPLLQAAFHGHLDVVEYLLVKEHANPWARDNRLGSTAIHLAAQAGNLAVVRCLCDYDLELIEARDNHESTPLFRAAQTGKVDVVKFLVESKEANMEARGYAGRTALLAASGEGHLNAVEYLVQHGADVNARDDENGLTALDLASHFGHKNIVDFLSRHTNIYPF